MFWHFDIPVMLLKLIRTCRVLLKVLLQTVVFGLLIVIILGVIELDSRPDLKVWHTEILTEEYRAHSDVYHFKEYLALEDRLFDQLDRLVYQQLEPGDRRAINRYNKGSLSDPGLWASNWNRSFEWPVDEPDLAVLLVHGMSDSPYSMRGIGQALHARGAWVLGLRVPGHGQAPSGLLEVEWEDMAAAVEIAVQHLREKVPDQALYIVGYSNGGALAVHYALQSIEDKNFPVVDGLVLMSPEIGISKLAALAVWQERLGHLLGLDKLLWNDLLPEYDPWKYGSFALNAGNQAYRITNAIQAELSQQEAAGHLSQMPPILAFQSVVDATVHAPDLVNHLFDRLPPPAIETVQNTAPMHELVLFDVNRLSILEPLLTTEPMSWLQPMLDHPGREFMLTLLSNRDDLDQRLVATTTMPESAQEYVCDTGLKWPDDVYSLSHVAMPFPPTDPVYGGDEAGPSAGIQLGAIALRGEKNALRVNASNMLRLRFNPFYSYMQYRILDFMQLQSSERDTDVRILNDSTLQGISASTNGLCFAKSQ